MSSVSRPGKKNGLVLILSRYLFAKKNCQSPPSEIIYVHSLNMLDFSPTPK
jgi:hypothetical protein